MSMIKNYANQHPRSASNFYSSTDLYPFYDIFMFTSNPNQEVLDGSYSIIS